LPVSVQVNPVAVVVTVKLNVCVLAEGAPAVVAARVTDTGPPTGVPAAAVTVRVTVTGVEEVGFTELAGENRQLAPVGIPVEQLSATAPANEPEAVTWNALVPDVPPCDTVKEFGDGVVRLKSTIWSVTDASCVVW
jgi:hypothetical protein